MVSHKGGIVEDLENGQGVTPEQQQPQPDPLPEVVYDDDGRRTVLLAFPKTIAGVELTKVTFRKPVGKDMEKMGAEKNEVSAIMRLAASLSGLPMSVFQTLDVEDYEACMMVAGSWSGKGLKGGQKIGQS